MTDNDSQSDRHVDAKRLSPDQEIVVAEVVAHAAAAELPLPESLLAAADDVASPRVAATLRRMAEQLRQGGSLDDLSRDPRRSTSFVTGLIRAGQQSGDLAGVLLDWSDCRRTVRQTWRSVIAAMLYPALLLVLLLVVIVGLDYALVGPLLAMYDDFEVELPGITKFLAWIHQRILPAILIGSPALVGGCVLYRLLGGAARLRRLVSALPVLGMMWHWTAVMELSRTLAVLLRCRVPLPDALQLAADGVHDANMREISRRLADGVLQGTALSDLIDSTYRLPATLVPLVRWGERTGQLPEAFELAGQMYEGRARLRAELLAALLPPLVFVAVATVIPLFLLGLYAPMVAMIQGLSWSAPARGDDWTTEISPVNYLALALLGAALLWAVRLVYGARRGPSEDLPKRLMLLAGWLLLMSGMIVGIIGLTGPLAIFPAIGLLVVALAYFKYMSAERRALLWSLAVAAEKGIPLEQAARAFADERSVQIGLRTARLADLLEEGVPLPVALGLSRNRVPADALLAARLGTDSGRMGETLRMSLGYSEQFDHIIRDVLAKYCYAIVVLSVGAGILSFVMLKIVPVFTKMFWEFDLELPALTQFVTEASEVFVACWYILLPPMLLMLAVLVSFGVAYFMGATRYELPVLHRFWRRCDSALVMRALAVSVRQHQDLAAAVFRLSKQYPRPSIGKRLAKASTRIDNGEHWAEALYRVRLIQAADLAVLQSAERVGNLAWALDEMADSTIRRFAYRLRALIDVVFPIVILTFGALVLVFVTAMFMPLIAMIQGLS